MSRETGSQPVPRGSRYGWVIIVIAAMAMVATLPGRTHGLGMITERLLAEERFHLERVQYSNINLWATLLGGLFCLPCGWLIDRFGMRITLTATIAALAATVLWMTRINDLPTLSVAILLTRGFGQSALSVISITMVGKWFRDKISLPMAVYSLLLTVGFIYASIAARDYANQDWRVLWSGMGYALVAFVPFALLLTREPPQSFESVSSSSQDATEAVSSPQGFTLRQAMGTSAFWLFGIAISLVALIGSGTSLFNESVLTQQGFPKETFYDLMALSTTVGLFVKLPIGWLGQRISLNKLLAAGLILLSVCLACLPYVHSPFGIKIYAVGMGVSGTITTVLFFTVWGQAFGRRYLGQIQSVSQMMTVLASALGPRMFAECFTRFGTYSGVFQFLAVLAMVVSIWSLFVRVPRPEEAPPTTHSDAVPALLSPLLQKNS